MQPGPTSLGQTAIDRLFRLCILVSVEIFNPAVASFLHTLIEVGGKNTPPLRILASMPHRDKTSMAIPPFSRPSSLTETLGILYDQTGCGNYKMAAADAEIVISRLSDVIAIKFRQLFTVSPHFRGSAI